MLTKMSRTFTKIISAMGYTSKREGLAGLACILQLATSVTSVVLWYSVEGTWKATMSEVSVFSLYLEAPKLILA